MTTRPDRGGDPPSRPPAVPDIPAQPTPEEPAAAGTGLAAAGEADAAPKPDRAQYGVCAFLALVGGLVIVDALRVGHALSTADPIGPKPVPILLGVLLLIVAAVYAVDVARGGAGEPEAGEDVDLTTPIDWRTVLLLIGAFLVNAVLIDRLGWVISGTILFWGSAYALGNRHYVRNLLIAVALSLVTFYTFAIGLGVNLPAGVLQGIL
ncbi:tripartite tricarboxylate transporter TctB family protein [Micromonospora halotolerans]|uniref:Tripartite tricarboxylate transporter TctB family protein n=1 Tax=Micromonospora halotolerans TaxID=709879 RepID=A0ABZ0A5L8_9ACTN|nr:tripartite tricarboxylate transporter TctB family protein [Micromonospora halotolerans]WNM42462.1 tripartite tricarboxylate transporter TctB family protein [Micromonospora halotolerans]